MVTLVAKTSISFTMITRSDLNVRPKGLHAKNDRA